MQVSPTIVPDVLILEPRVHSDERGFFFETFRADHLAAAGIGQAFMQENHSGSRRNVLRGLHYQVNRPQGKLVRVVIGEVFDVSLDLRRSSPTFRKWVGVQLSAENRRQLWVPPGFAHGFLVLSEWAEVLYKTTDYYAPSCERTLLWNDPELGIDWPLAGPPLLSAKDARGLPLGQADTYP